MTASETSPIIEEVTLGPCRLILGDCLEVLPSLGLVDAVITDPPYGIGADTHQGSAANGWRQYGAGGWDAKRPPREAFEMMLKLGEVQVIWGGNYFTDYLPPSMQWLIWDKGQRGFSLADAELAWSSRDAATRAITYSRGKALQDGKEHPTQKPVTVMQWCMDKAKVPEGALVLDPFAGSGTTGIACIRTERAFIGIEKDPTHYRTAVDRIARELQQQTLAL